MLKTESFLVGGKRMRYLSGGTGSVLIFLHGYPGTPLSYLEGLELLAVRYRVYAPFLLDLDCANAEEITQQLTKFITHLKLKKIILVGHSFGGLVATYYATSNNSKVTKLVLINTAGIPSASYFKRIKNFVQLFSLLFKDKPKNILRHGVTVHDLAKSLIRRKPRKLLKELLGRINRQTHLCYVFKKLKVKTFIIWSKNDALFPLSNAKELQKMIKRSTISIVDGQHMWPVTQPEKFAKTILKLVT